MLPTMKTTATFLALSLVLAAALPARAQIFRPQTTNGVVLGGIAGAIIGNNSGDLHNDPWRGAVIGAAVGGLLGSAAADAQDWRTQVPVPAAPPRPVVRDHDASANVLLGGIAGAIIGNNSGNHNPWQGAAIGAGAGYILGRLGDNQPRHAPPVPSYAYAPVVYAVRAAAPASSAVSRVEPRSVTIINNYYGAAPASPMGAANAMFGR
jgi:uncharacterized membrane protein